jgi:hypothetical protein
MPFTPANKISQEEFAEVLETLEIYLDKLPKQLPQVDGPTSLCKLHLDWTLKLLKEPVTKLLH